MLGVVLEGFVLGLSLAAPPGSVNAVIANRGLSRWFKGFLVGAGALSADMIFLFVTIVFGQVIPEVLMPWIGLFGSFLLFYMAFSVLFGDSSSKNTVSSNSTLLWDYLTGLLMGLTNPYQIGWWLSAGVSLAHHFGFMIFVGFVLGILTWIVAFPFSINRIGGRKSVFFAVRIVSFVVLLVFGLLLFYYGVSSLSF